MIDLLFQIQLWVYFAAGLFALLLGLVGRLPSLVSIGALAITELGLLIQLVVSIVLVANGAQAKQDTFEFFGYLVVALLVPPAVALWALVERTKWSTVILGAGAITVAVMLVRMHQIWTGTNF
jgi:hypothetical protein